MYGSLSDPSGNRPETTQATGCPLTAAVNAIGGKGNLICLYWLDADTRRFNELSPLLASVDAQKWIRERTPIADYRHAARQVRCPFSAIKNCIAAVYSLIWARSTSFATQVKLWCAQLQSNLIDRPVARRSEIVSSSSPTRYS